jgi:hypothetical protein
LTWIEANLNLIWTGDAKPLTLIPLPEGHFVTEIMTTNLKALPAQIEAKLPEIVKETPWTRTVAAGSLLAGAYLLFTGRRKAALAAAFAGAAVAALEKPELIKEIWDNTPKYLRAGQDFLLRAEDVVEDLKAKGEKLKGMLSKA